MFSVEQAERVRVGEHQAGDVVPGLRRGDRRWRSRRARRCDLDHLVAGHRHRRRVGAVGRVGGEDLGRCLAAVGVDRRGSAAVPASSPCEPAEGCRLTCGRPQISAQRALEQPHQLEGALGPVRLLGRVKPRVAGQRRHPLVEPRVVLHRAGAERIEAGVEVEVAAREPVVVTDDLRLGDLRQPRRLGSRSRSIGISSSSGGSGTPASGSCAARRPRFDRSKIVRTFSDCMLSSRSSAAVGWTFTRPPPTAGASAIHH